VHSGFHRAISESILGDEKLSPFGPFSGLKCEVKVGHSRMDFLGTLQGGKGVLIEVKGCTLTRDGKALFPDAPTERGRRHLETLMEARGRGMRAAIMILVFRADSNCFSPNAETDPKFTEAFWKASEEGVEVYPLVLSYENGSLFYHGQIPICQK